MTLSKTKWRYYCNPSAAADGGHTVHREDCPTIDSSTIVRFLGAHSSVRSAPEEAVATRNRPRPRARCCNISMIFQEPMSSSAPPRALLQPRRECCAADIHTAHSAMRRNASKRALASVFARYDRRVMNNIDRAAYAESLVATLLEPAWLLTWATGYDWAPWDLEHRDGTRLEVKQSAARQTWHEKQEDIVANPPRFDIAPRTGYWDRAGKWIDKPGRHAHLYLFAWHLETRKCLADQRVPEQWTFYVVRTACLPEQESIGLKRLRCLAEPLGAKSLSKAVEHVHERNT